MLDFATVLRSPSFKFLLGKEHTCLTIPKSLAKGISDPIHALMNNEHMVEAQKDLAFMDDVEADTFVGFCEFAYTGDYCSRMRELQPEIPSNRPAPVESVEVCGERAVEQEEAPAEPPPVDLATTEIPTEAEAEAVEDTWGLEVSDSTWGGFGRVPGKGKKKKQTKQQQLYTDFLNLNYEYSSHLVSNKQPISANGDKTSASGTTPSLLYHAKIYVFAEKYLIDNLRILSLRKLHSDLRDFDLTLETSGLILELLEFTYARTERKESSDDELRVLTVHYVSYNGEILKQNPNFRSLLENDGEMTCDLLYKNWGDSV